MRLLLNFVGKDQIKKRRATFKRERKIIGHSSKPPIHLSSGKAREDKPQRDIVGEASQPRGRREKEEEEEEEEEEKTFPHSQIIPFTRSREGKEDQNIWTINNSHIPPLPKRG